MSVPIQQLKSKLRGEVKSRLAALSKEAITQSSANITKQLLESGIYNQSKRIAIYLSLPEEVQTYDIIKDIFNHGKECFIPRYTKTEMSMVKLYSLKDLENLPVTKWNIKQPSLAEEREDAFEKGGVDLVVVPGLAFTISGGRLGRGKGYYDKYLKELASFRKTNGMADSITVGLALTEQLYENLPVAYHDFMLSYIIYPMRGKEEKQPHWLNGISL